MSVFHTILHPTDFDGPSVEAFRVSRELAKLLGAKIIAFHVAAPPAVLTQDGRIARNSDELTPVDLWASYRDLQDDDPDLTVDYAVVVGKESEATRLLRDLIGRLPPGVLIVMGDPRERASVECLGEPGGEVVRTAPCPVLVVKEPPASRSDLNKTRKLQISEKY